MKVYKIRDENGLYSTGGISPAFNKSGKTWNNIGHLKNHLRQFFDSTNYVVQDSEIYDTAEIVAIEIVETEVEKTPVPDLIIEMMEKDVEEYQERSANYPQSTYYSDLVVRAKNNLRILKARRDEAS